MKKGLWKNDLTSLVFLIIITTVCTLFLSGANTVYQGVLAERQKELRMGILSTFGVSFTEDTFTERFNENVEVIICGDFGPNAYSVLDASGIQMYTASEDLVDTLLADFHAGNLRRAISHSRHGHGRRR